MLVGCICVAGGTVPNASIFGMDRYVSVTDDSSRAGNRSANVLITLDGRLFGKQISQTFKALEAILSTAFTHFICHLASNIADSRVDE